MAGQRRLKIDRGVDRDIDLRIYDPDDIVYDDNNPSPFLDDDTLSMTVWLGNDSPPLITLPGAWLNSSATTTAEYRVSFAETDTEDLDPGVYSARVMVTRGSVTASVFDGFLEIAQSPGPVISPTAPPTFTPAAARPRLDTVYCTDEDIALRAPRDFKPLCPPWMLLAAAKDGAFTTTSRWTLSSASVDFEAAGVMAGHVLMLDRVGIGAAGAPDLFAVESVSGGSVLLRRPGQLPGIGQPPGPVAGSNGMGFEVRTFASQIDDASFDLNSIFGITTGDLASVSPILLQRPRELRRLCVLSVLIQAYAAAWQEKSDDWAMKLELAQREWDDVRARLVVHVVDTVVGPVARTIGVRISR